MAYFTAPISGAYTKVAATPVKKSSRRPSDVTMSPPANLVTPREIKSLANRSAAVTSSVSEPPSVATPTLETEIAAPTAALPTTEAHVGQKRRADDVQKEEASGSRTVPGGQRPRPRPPPAKRQKQAGSLFIPKKVQLQFIGYPCVKTNESTEIIARLSWLSLHSCILSICYRRISFRFSMTLPHTRLSTSTSICL